MNKPHKLQRGSFGEMEYQAHKAFDQAMGAHFGIYKAIAHVRESAQFRAACEALAGAVPSNKTEPASSLPSPSLQAPPPQEWLDEAMRLQGECERQARHYALCDTIEERTPARAELDRLRDELRSHLSKRIALPVGEPAAVQEPVAWEPMLSQVIEKMSALDPGWHHRMFAAGATAHAVHAFKLLLREHRAASLPQAAGVLSDERETFEAWARERMRGILKPESRMMLSGDERTAYYADAATAWAWDAWRTRATESSPKHPQGDDGWRGCTGCTVLNDCRKHGCGVTRGLWKHPQGESMHVTPDLYRNSGKSEHVPQGDSGATIDGVQEVPRG
jgi:hypothetical protein